jgi:hypothetical protein
MNKSILIIVSFLIFISAIFFSCKKDVGINPLLAFSDKALYDSSKNEAAFVYYKNAPATIYSGTNGPHGSFKLRFNKVAATALTDNGKLPVGQKFPDGSFIVKDVQSSGLIAFMYKKSNSWLWGEINTDGSVYFSVNKDATTCTSCHNQTGQRDLVVSFNFY